MSFIFNLCFFCLTAYKKNRAFHISLTEISSDTAYINQNSLLLANCFD